MAGQSQNPVSRTLSPASPIWAPFAMNAGFLLAIFAYNLYNYIPIASAVSLTAKAK